MKKLASFRLPGSRSVLRPHARVARASGRPSAKGRRRGTSCGAVARRSEGALCVICESGLWAVRLYEGADRFPSGLATTPAAPGRFSITTGCPIASLMPWAKARAVMSGRPPAPKPTQHPQGTFRKGALRPGGQGQCRTGSNGVATVHEHRQASVGRNIMQHLTHCGPAS